MISLGGITLSDHLVLTGLESAQLVGYGVIQTIGGKAYVQSDANDPVAGVELTLSGVNHFTLSEIQALRDLRGQTVELVHHRGTFNVLIINTPVEPAVDYADPQDDDWYSGEIQMITV